MQTTTINNETVYIYTFKCWRCKGKYEFKSYFTGLNDSGCGMCAKCKEEKCKEIARVWAQGTCG